LLDSLLQENHVTVVMMESGHETQDNELVMLQDQG